MSVKKKTDKIWAAIEKCFKITDTIWLPDETTTLYEQIWLILEEKDNE